MSLAKKRKVCPEVYFCNGLEIIETQYELIQQYQTDASPTKQKDSCFAIVDTPTKVCSIYNVLDINAANGLLNEIQEMSFQFKENDLLSLHQTQDLNGIKDPFIRAVKDFIYTKIKSLVEKATRCKFNNTVDLHAIKFTKNDNLLCHSDFLNTRHTAFILYLVPETWCKESGGTLDFFMSDENCQPTDIAVSLTPKFNSFSWFRVSKQSWHQVSEILGDDVRWSISGWFHSDDVIHKIPLQSDYQLHIPIEPIDSDVGILKSWVSLKYLNLEVSTEVQDQFQDDSEVSLANFLHPEKYSELCTELASMNWNLIGPRNKLKFKDSCNPSKTVKDFINLLKTDAMALLLSHCTGLALSRYFDDPESGGFTTDPFGIINTSVQRWEKGFYSLIRDQDVCNLTDRLHLFYHADVYKEYDVDVGGYISFVSKDAEEPLLVVPPQSNTLSLVFTRADEFGFTKYINSKLQKPFYCITAQYIARKSVNDEADCSSYAEESKYLGDRNESDQQTISKSD